MTIKKKLITFIFACAMVLSLIPTINVQAATTDFNIISDTDVTAQEAKKWAKSKGATDTFISLADLYWKYSEDCGGVNPGIAYVQAAKETGYGKFGGVIDATYHNPCGLKTAAGGDNYDPNAHQKFNSWDEGVQAHMDHLALYAGANGYPKSNSYDPRHFRTIKGRATTVRSLSGNWAPSTTYGDEIVSSYVSLLDSANVNYEEDDNNSNSSNSNENTSNKDSSSEDYKSDGDPNPGTPESKPKALNVTDVVKETKSTVQDENKDTKPTITSTKGWKKENDSWYFYNSDNTKVKGWIKPEDNNWYYLKDDGKMTTGWFQVNGTWYYFNESGVMAKGWLKLSDNWYYLNNTGAMLTGIQNGGSGLYYLKDSGEMYDKSGWNKIKDKWYYVESSGRLKTGWLKDNSLWYYLQGDGTMVTGLKKIDGQTYLLNDSGSMEAGWNKINNNWYYFNNSGSLSTGWIIDNGQNYYLYNTGAMATGWINLNGTWYYLKSSGAMQTGWIKVGTDWYYLDPGTGRMLTNTTVEGYALGSNGKMKDKSNQNSNNDKSSNNSSSTSNNSTSTKKETATTKTNNASTSKKTIVVDAGHAYGTDTGVVTNINGVKYDETELDIQLAGKLKSELEKRGFNVIMTRNVGETPSYGSLYASLAHRVEVANDADADFFISIHHNAVDGIPDASGVETYYSTNSKDSSYGGGLDNTRMQQSMKMAKAINNSIINKIGARDRGAKSDASAAVKTLFVLRNTNMPAVLVETGFLSNQAEAKRCADPSSQQLVAEAIADAIAANY
ncbi:N-acetylmuramoyl-L-alanine amidase [Clostridium saccharobutylicum]|uniref:N-acetylmuramoyl-L-alanine amidase n=1 Tax=Clostridium saccharobutylicum TaxID=169679 RepID=UPI0004124CAC|nr:N-acetylmuramoyl-L-alanine amidase [Clostridium saccharobutylicum]AQR92394.1 toxin B [Clostridium saccharobutylicum]AQS02297.1 toxin B [Clostridium saccharobutylicum]AQS11901.1 toxin B [Clostridium saccharobutylicum]AQS16280.1 toxin B [Clostridium saccharobutylicum]MBA2904955.1 glucan-binding YG repeat protein [Clostridium saccharobutylicum]